MSRLCTTLFVWFLAAGLTLAQNDTIESLSGDILVGEIKSMTKGVLVSAETISCSTGRTICLW